MESCCPRAIWMQRILSVACGLLVLFLGFLLPSVWAAPPAGAVAGYGDVAVGRYYTSAVQWAADNGITDFDDSCFMPEAQVSRGEVAVHIWNMEGRGSAPSHSFRDVTEELQNDAISWMVETGLTTGTSDATFSPDRTVTRVEMAAFLHRLAGEPTTATHQFVDVFESWQQAPVSWMVEAGITTGTSVTTFSPESALTRSQAVTFLYRYQGEPEVTVDSETPACLATELTRLEQTAREWDPSARVTIAVVRSDGRSFGVRENLRVSSASAIKPLVTAAAIDSAGIEAVVPLAHRTIALSDNYATGEMIDLVGSIDDVNQWIGEVAGLADTHISIWRFGGRRVSSLGRGPTRTTMTDLVSFYLQLHQYELLEKVETDQLTDWLRQTPRRLTGANGALVDRLPSEIAETVLNKTGWLPPGSTEGVSQQLIDAGLVFLPDGEWFALALSSNGARFDVAIRWLGYASCRIYVVAGNDPEHDCTRIGDPR